MMKYVIACLLSLFLFYTSGISSVNLISNNNQTIRYGHLKILMNNLQNQKWDDQEVPCLEGLMRIMRNVQNSTLWATWLWDSMQSPVGQLYGSRYNYGNYDECVEFNWEKVDSNMRSQYCLANIHLSDVDVQDDDVDLFGNVTYYIRTRTKYYLKFNTLIWGVCTPATCKPRSVVKFVSVLFKQTHLGLSVNNPNISIEYCDIAGDKKVVFDVGFYFTLSLLTFVTVFVVFVTWIGNSNKLNKRITRFFKIFHLSRNIQSLLSISNSDVRSLFGIRTISCGLVVGVHVWFLMNTKGVINALTLNKEFDNLSWIFTFEMAVDTFLLISGLLLVKCLPRKSQMINPVKLIVQRYIRMAFPMGIILLIIVTLNKISRGPGSNEIINREINACNKYWWRNLLMIHNYIDIQNMCLPISWTVACDFHLSIVGILICWLYIEKKLAGFIIFIITFIVSIVTPAAFVYSDHQRYWILAMDFRLSYNYRNYILQNYLHINTHFRAAAYFIGMIIGYVMLKYDPVDHRNVINKKKSLLGLCGFLAIFIGLFVLNDYMMKRQFGTVIETAVFASFKRVIWALSVGIFIMICEYGTLPLVTSVLNWSAWALFSKLTYGIYLLHGLFMVYIFNMSRSPLQYASLGSVLNIFSVVIVSAAFSLYLWLIFEAPMQNIVALLLKTRNEKQKQDAMEAAYKQENNATVITKINEETTQ